MQFLTRATVFLEVPVLLKLVLRHCADLSNIGPIWLAIDMLSK